MLFCPRCGTILRLRDKAGKNILWCSCGFTANPEEVKSKLKKESPEEKKEAKEELPKETRRLDIVKELETHPKIKAVCEKCNNKEAYYWTQQTRGADEPETRFFKCTKCSHTWREYA